MFAKSLHDCIFHEFKQNFMKHRTAYTFTIKILLEVTHP